MVRLTRFQNGAVQVRRMTLRARHKPTLTLFPMVHVAQPGFFSRVAAQANDCDIVLYEGVKSAAGRAANFAYRIAAAGRSPLSAQNVAMKSTLQETPCAGGAIWINSDVPRDRFKSLWSKVPWWQRLAFYTVMPIVGLALRFRRVRDWLAEAMDGAADTDMDDRFGPFGPEFKEAVMDARDAHLLGVVETHIAERAAQSIAVVWGARHMPPLIKALVYHHGYKTEAEDWQTVFVTDAATMDQAEEKSVSA